MKRLSLPLLVTSMLVWPFLWNPLAGNASAQTAKGTLPSFVVMAVNPGGALLNTLGNGLAKMISEKGPFEVKLRTSSGHLDKLVNDGDVNFSMSVSVEAYQSSRGLEHYSERPQKKIRLVASGPPLVAGFLVRKDSPIQAVTDLKGKKVAGKFPGTKPLYWDGVAMLATVGMTWDDLNVIPVGNIVEGSQSFIQGRVEATIAAMRTGMVQEADATLKGVRFLGLPGGKEAAKKMWDAVAGCYLVPMKAGSALGVDRDMNSLAKDIYVLSGLVTSPDVVYEATKIMWNDMAGLHDVHPMFKFWGHDKMLKADVTIPYHEGAIRFYKEAGKWTPELEGAQKKLEQSLK